MVFGWLFLSYAYFFQGGGWNPNSRLDLTRAIAERGSIAIDAYVGNTDDWARSVGEPGDGADHADAAHGEPGGHYYTNKAPGLSFVAVPFYAATSALLRSATADSTAKLRTSGYVANLGANALPSAALGVLSFCALGWAGIAGARTRAVLAVAFGLGTLGFPYSTAFYAHQPAAVASFASFAALWRAREATRPQALGLAAGAAAGTAVLFEMSTVLIIAGIGAIALGDARARRALPAFVAGGLPFALALGLYNQAAYGSPFETHIAHANPAIEARIDGALFAAPPLSRVYELTFSRYRGVFFSSPLLLLAFAGFAALWRRDRFVAAVCAAVPTAFFALILCFNAWNGGWAPGPRYLIPALPFLFLPAAFGALRWPAAALGLAGVSIAMMTLVALVAVEVPTTVEDPIFGFALPLLGEGQVSANSQELDAYWFAHDYAELDAAPTWASFNLGELLWFGSRWSVLPLFAAWAAFAVGVARLPDDEAGQAP
jgi:hypothetical protein